MESGKQIPVLVDQFEVDTVEGAEMLLPTERNLIFYRFEGRVLGSAARSSFAIALRPEDAAALVRTTVESFAAAREARDAFGSQS